MTPLLPRDVKAFVQQREAFEAWLIGRGSAVLAPTNPYEVMRFIAREQIAIIYRNTNDRILAEHWRNGAAEAYMAFLTGRAWRAVKKTSVGPRKRINLVRSLAERDGWTCVYCGKELAEHTATIEHFVALTHGGPDHPANQLLACSSCNRRASHLSVREKVEVAIKGRLP